MEVLTFPRRFKDSKDGNFITSASPVDFLSPFGDMHVAGKTADESLVNFDLAAQLSAVAILQSKSDAVSHEPSGFLSDAKPACDFVAADAVLVVGNHPHCGKPLIKADGANPRRWFRL